MAERTYRIHIAAELSGVRVELIRAWERRYGILTPERTPSGYRVYTERDVALLKRLKQLTDEGVAISEAARMVPRLLSELASEPPPGEVRPAVNGAQLEAWKAAMLSAAEDYDQTRVSEILDEALSALPPLKAYEDVLSPVQLEVGDRWHAGLLTVAQEHLVSQMVRMRMVSMLHGAPKGGRRHAVLSCFPEEQHEIGLLGAALRLRHAGVRVTLLGQRVPAADLGRVVTRLRPDLVGLSCVTDEGRAAFESMLTALVDAMPRGQLVWVGGRAALAHREVCARIGVRLFEDERDWTRLLE
ncbi:transcriptional regulator [Corallococcus sp. H22C18031201]|uniref:MerR family transcriptional regulator n=1 Tax=Citreicoccus inhibens TaxID=2849499 RepID=UPI000E713B62|nr:MerR family transcriptional regulator [Citreicoccus inhibens]MBU8898777.1 MerR family transcriptional regulator [Citreicoccus inhibens]RJS24262.1 transcriptional regulator [Corallococcus sp. H22C18031201]